MQLVSMLRFSRVSRLRSRISLSFNHMRNQPMSFKNTGILDITFYQYIMTVQFSWSLMPSSLPADFADDYLLGLLAVKRGLITKSLLEEAIEIRLRSHPTPRLIDVIVNLCNLTPTDLHDVHCLFRSLLFGSIVVSMGYVSESQLSESLEIQNNSSTKPLLGKILFDLGYLTNSQLQAALAKQEYILSSIICNTLPSNANAAGISSAVKRYRLSNIHIADANPSFRQYAGMATGFAFLVVIWLLLHNSKEKTSENNIKQLTLYTSAENEYISPNNTQSTGAYKINKTHVDSDVGNLQPFKAISTSVIVPSDQTNVKTHVITNNLNRTVPEHIKDSDQDTSKPSSILPRITECAFNENSWNCAIKQKTIRKEEQFITYVGEDWRTQGTWIGRYGTYAYILPAMNGSFDVNWSENLPSANVPYKFRITGKTRFFNNMPDDIRRWVHALNWDDSRVLQNPTDFPNRRQSEIDNHQEAYPDFHSDINIELELDLRDHPGLYTVSFYFFNKDGHTGKNRYRDYMIEAAPIQLKPEIKFRDTIKQTKCYARITQFRGGVYKKFAAKGNVKYAFTINNNSSFNAICCGIFVDKIDSSTCQYDEKMLSISNKQFSNKSDTDNLLLCKQIISNADAYVTNIRQKCCNWPAANEISREIVRTTSKTISLYHEYPDIDYFYTQNIKHLDLLCDYDRRDILVNNYIQYIATKTNNSKFKYGRIFNSLKHLSELCLQRWVVSYNETDIYANYFYATKIIYDNDSLRLFTERINQCRYDVSKYHLYAILNKEKLFDYIRVYDKYKYAQYLSSINRYYESTLICMQEMNNDLSLRESFLCLALICAKATGDRDAELDYMKQLEYISRGNR